MDHAAAQTAFRSSVLLANFGPATSVYTDRAEYSEHALSSSLAEKEISSQSRFRLLRDVGIGKFNKGKWTEASVEFEKLLNSTEESDQALAQMYLGWIEINLKKPDLAFMRWLNGLALNQTNSRPGLQSAQWRRLFLKDLGRVLVEGGGGSPEQLKQVYDLPKNAEDRSYLEQGIKKGILFILKDLDRWKIFSKSLLGSILSHSVGKLVIEEQKQFSNHCELLEWVDQDHASQSELREPLLHILQGCVRELSALEKGKAEAGSKGQSKTQAKIQNVSKVLGWIKPDLGSREEPLLKDAQFRPLVHFIIENEPKAAEQQKILEIIYPNPEAVSLSKDPMPLLLWMGVLQASGEEKSDSSPRHLWIQFVLDNPEAMKGLTLSSADVALIALQLSEQEKVYLPVWKHAAAWESKLGKSEKALDYYDHWLTELMALFISGSISLPAPEKNTIAEVYFQSAELLKAGANKAKPDSNGKKAAAKVKSPYLLAVREVTKAWNLFEKAERIKLSLSSSNFVDHLQKKLKLTQDGYLSMREGVSKALFLKSLLGASLDSYIGNLQSQISALQPPHEWPSSAMEDWKNQKIQILQKLDEWRSL
jgi:hypothetical protein